MRNVCGVAALGLAACGGAVEVDEAAADPAPFGSAYAELESQNALTSNALTSNALTSNALTSNALTSNALTSNALTSNALTSNALGTDARARELLKYVVSCALPAGSTLSVEVEGSVYTFDGQLGLAPEWGLEGGTCDAACQGWVSSCVLNRVNFLGQVVPISMRGDNDVLATTAEEREAYPVQEAARYGNLFTVPQERYGCLAPGQTGMFRSCGPHLENCPWVVVGSCEEACDGQTPDGGFLNCHTALRDGSGAYPADAAAYPHTITVHLQP